MQFSLGWLACTYQCGCFSPCLANITHIPKRRKNNVRILCKGTVLIRMHPKCLLSMVFPDRGADHCAFFMSVSHRGAGNQKLLHLDICLDSNLSGCTLAQISAESAIYANRPRHNSRTTNQGVSKQETCKKQRINTSHTNTPPTQSAASKRIATRQETLNKANL